MPVDQFEEFLAPSAGSRAAKFLKFLEQVCQHRNDRMLVVGTMRSDYLDVYERHPHALKAPKFHPWRLEPFPREHIENVTIKPAERVHVEVADDLLEQSPSDASERSRYIDLLWKYHPRRRQDLKYRGFEWNYLWRKTAPRAAIPWSRLTGDSPCMVSRRPSNRYAWRGQPYKRVGNRLG